MELGALFYVQLKFIFNLTIISCVPKQPQGCKIFSQFRLQLKQMQPNSSEPSCSLTLCLTKLHNQPRTTLVQITPRKKLT